MEDSLIYEWFLGHPYLGTFLIVVLFHYSYSFICMLVVRLIRLTAILCRGWPTNQWMDADGDIVFNANKK